MSRRWVASAVSVLFLGATPISYPVAPSTTRYRIDSKSEQVVDLSAMGQPNQSTSATQMAVLTVSLSDTSGGQLMHVVLDTIASDSPMAGADLQQARGGWVHGTLDAWGRAKVTKSSADSNATLAQLKVTMVRFFPVIKPGAKQGVSWVDTVTTETKTAAQAMKLTAITTFTHGGSVTRDGQPAIRIDATSELVGAGTMENPQAGTMQVDLKNSATASYYIGTDGRFLGGESKSEGLSQVRAQMSPIPIPVTVKQTSTFSVLK